MGNLKRYIQPVLVVAVPESVIYLIIEMIIPLNVKEKNHRRERQNKIYCLKVRKVGKLQARLPHFQISSQVMYLFIIIL